MQLEFLIFKKKRKPADELEEENSLNNLKYTKEEGMKLDQNQNNTRFQDETGRNQTCNDRHKEQFEINFQRHSKDAYMMQMIQKEHSSPIARTKRNTIFIRTTD
jgi:hypothetical protein